MSRSGSGNARDSLLDAAEALVRRDGVSTLTLERVAAEARVSKGGLLYHFPSKDRLIEAMIERHLRIHMDGLGAALRTEVPGAGRFSRAVLRAAFAQSARPPERERRMAAGLLAAVATRPALLAPVREAYRQWLKEACADGLPSGQAIAVLAALDGLWFWGLFGLVDLPAARIKDVRRALKTLAGADAKPS